VDSKLLASSLTNCLAFLDVIATPADRGFVTSGGFSPNRSRRIRQFASFRVGVIADDCGWEATDDFCRERSSARCEADVSKRQRECDEKTLTIGSATGKTRRRGSHVVASEKPPTTIAQALHARVMRRTRSREADFNVPHRPAPTAGSVRKKRSCCNSELQQIDAQSRRETVAFAIDGIVLELQPRSGNASDRPTPLSPGSSLIKVTAFANHLPTARLAYLKKATPKTKFTFRTVNA